MFSCCFRPQSTDDIREPTASRGFSRDISSQLTLDINTLYEVREKKLKLRKKTIPKSLRIAVWNTYVGEDVGRTACDVCKTNIITQMSFHCGHVEAENKGGATTLTNLRPICASCNLSMGTTNMMAFKDKFFPVTRGRGPFA